MPLFSFYSSFGVEYNSKEIWLFCVVSLIDGIRWYDLCVRSSLKIFAKVNYLRVSTRVWIIQVQPNKNLPQDSPFGKRQLLPLPLLPKRKLVIRWGQDEHHPGQNLKIPMMDIQGILTGFELKANCIWMNVNDIFWSFFMGYFGPFTLDFYMLNPFCAGISISFFFFFLHLVLPLAVIQFWIMQLLTSGKWDSVYLYLWLVEQLVLR